MSWQTLLSSYAPAGFWRFNGNGNDSSGNARNLSVSGGHSYTTGLVTGDSDQCISMGGTVATISSGSVPAELKVNRDFTYLAIVEPSGTTGIRGVVSHRSGGAYLRITATNNYPEFVKSQTSLVGTGNVSAPAGSKSLVALTVGAGATATWELSVNGVLAGTGTTSLTFAGTGNFAVGSEGGVAEGFAGKLDEAAVLPVALTLSQLADLTSWMNGVDPGGGPTPPDAPSDLAATWNAGTGKVDLTFEDNADDETGFKVQRDTVPTFDFGPATETIDTADTEMASLTVPAGDTTYYYRVCATNAGGDSDWAYNVGATQQYVSVAVPESAPDTTPPAAPTGVTATPRAGAVVRAAATKADDADLDYTEIGYSINGGAEQYAQIDKDAANQYYDITASHGQSVSVRARSVDTATPTPNASAWTDAVVAVADGEPPRVIAGIINEDGTVTLLSDEPWFVGGEPPLPESLSFNINNELVASVSVDEGGVTIVLTPATEIPATTRSVAVNFVWQEATMVDSAGNEMQDFETPILARRPSSARFGRSRRGFSRGRVSRR